MLDFFTIFSKGGIVLWCFQGTSQLFTPAVNSLIKTVILQERTGNNTFTHEALQLKYKLDNEFELVFVVAYQKILQLSYIDKFLTDIQMEFRNKYKDCLTDGLACGTFNFKGSFDEILRFNEEESRAIAKSQKKMKTFDESVKSKKTVSSMIENKKEEKKPAKGKENKPVKEQVVKETVKKTEQTTAVLGEMDELTIQKNREKMFAKMSGKKPVKTASASPKAETPKKKGKQATKWEMGGTNKDAVALDYSSLNGSGDATINGSMEEKHGTPSAEEQQWVGQMKGGLRDLDEEESEDEEEEEKGVQETVKSGKSKKGSGMFSMFKNLVGSKTLTKEDLQPALEKMKEHIIGKNVAADISAKLCDSVAAKLEGKVLGTFSTTANTVKQTLQDSCVHILEPKRRIDILRDAMECKQKGRPYVVTFCGVNGVGKSTNLAKICFWLIENGFRVLIAACDTFRAGAVEQLRTHTRKLNALHPPDKNGQHMVQLYEKGYGKDAAGIAMEAINFARDCHIDVVLVDTAGRMQDNEPLMRALSKLIKVNQPDLVLFVGEALVGNEAVDQLTKFNQALADHSNMTNPRLIDGIVLTKFDTIDDKVGAAISMTYTTGQPIVFVGTGQTYTDLRNLNVKAVVNALLK
ncbi:signal recognition particle receptor subunit alpha-like [Mytilus californianus]|uniref:signal recognition particle receptor subunit alpha-like n=1 Tax=Mytilus californianus TaxID=6549 RepID=UPI0022471424|nr:signal recognition particle receptor subunit alpha-like [Mytilus californianus]